MAPLLLPDAAHAAVGAATLLVALLLTGLGALAGARRPFVALVAGWGLADLVLLACATGLGIPLTPLLAALAVAGTAGLVRAARGGFPAPEWTMAGRVLLIAAPLLVIAAAVSPAGFDEYSHWLPNLAYLVLHDHLPTLAEPNTVSVRPGYPPGLAFVGLAVSRIVGHLAESAGVVWSTLLAVAAGAMGAEVVARRWPGAPWACAAIGVAVGTVLSPSFEPWLVLSNYGDAAAGNVAAVVAVGLMLRLAAGDAWPWRIGALGLGGAALVCVRQDSFTVYALLVVGAFAAALAERRRLAPLLEFLPAPVLAAAIWRFYQGEDIPRGAAGMLPPGEWHWAQLPDMLASMAQAMLRHWAHFGLLLVLVTVAIVAVAMPRRFAPLPRVAAVLGAVVGLGKIATLALLYLGADFSTAQAGTATEFWRFSLHAGPTVTLAALALVPFRASPPRWQWAARALPWLAAALPLAYVAHLRVDFPRGRAAPAQWLRDEARAVAAAAGTAPVTLIDTTDAPYMDIPHTVFVRYELLVGQRPRADVAVPPVRLVEGDPPREVILDGSLLTFAPPGSAGDAARAPFLWVFDGGEAASRLVGLDLPQGSSYLLAREGAKSKILRVWPLPEDWARGLSRRMR